MDRFEPCDPAFSARVRAGFGRQRLRAALGAELVDVGPGAVTISMPFRDDLTQQHGFLHAGVITAIVDSACGYAALSLMPAGMEVLTVEYKVNFLAPAYNTSRSTRTGREVRTIAYCVHRRCYRHGCGRPRATHHHHAHDDDGTLPAVGEVQQRMTKRLADYRGAITCDCPGRAPSCLSEASSDWHAVPAPARRTRVWTTRFR